MWATQAYVAGDTVTIRDEKLKRFDGQQITVSILLPEQKKNAATRFFETAKRMHGNSAGQTWTREELHERLVISAALSKGCNSLYSEDLNDGQIIENLLIHNPL